MMKYTQMPGALGENNSCTASWGLASTLFRKEMSGP